MSGNFGALTDHFGILAISDGGTGTLGDVLELIESSNDPTPKSKAVAEDEAGDIVESTFFGNSGGAIKEASSKFRLKSGTLDTARLKIGELATGKVVEKIGIITSNKEWPSFEFSGKLGTTALQSREGKLATATLPSFTIRGAKLAQPISFTYAAGCRLTGSKFTASGKIEDTKDGLGEPVAFGISFEAIEVSADFVRVSAAPAWTPTGDLVEKQAPTLKESGPEYHTSTASGEIPLVRDVEV